MNVLMRILRLDVHFSYNKKKISTIKYIRNNIKQCYFLYYIVFVPTSTVMGATCCVNDRTILTCLAWHDVRPMCADDN